MPVLTTGYFSCNQCGSYFKAGDGGVCRRCQRVLCNRHLHGASGWWRRLLFRQEVCRSCRGSGEDPASARSED